MKKLLILVILFTVVACNENNKKRDKKSPQPISSQNKSENPPEDSKINKKDPFSIHTNTSGAATVDTTVTKEKNINEISGGYIKNSEPSDVNCSCYCLNIQFTSSEKLCISPGKIYINAKFSKTKSDTINVYYINAFQNNNDGKDIPWDKFDTHQPIANIVPAQGKQISLNWLGFTINGDLAIDYAIYGKKTLEGTFKKN